MLLIMREREISQAIKLRTYNSVIRSLVLCGYETWVLSRKLEQRLQVFENTVIRGITGLFFDYDASKWRRRYCIELREITQPL